MSCQHGNWAPCDACDEIDRAYASGAKQIAALTEQRDALVAALETLRDYAREAAALNDADHVSGNSIKAHKMLLALAGVAPGYSHDIDGAFAALKAEKGEA